MMIKIGWVRKILMFSIVLSLLQFPAWANLTLPKTNKANNTNKASNNTGKTTKKKEQIIGRLIADGPVLVNGNKAASGDTIYSGSLIETPANIGATIQLCTIGQLDLSPDTCLTVNYDSELIHSALTKGCAIVTTNEGVNGLLGLPNGEERRVEPGKIVSLCADGNDLIAGARSGQVCQYNCDEPKDEDGGGLGWWALGGILLGVGGLVLSGIVRGNTGTTNPSPSLPQR